jgi:hypothetical protein
MPEAPLLEFTELGPALTAAGLSAPSAVRWVPLISCRLPGA